MKTIFFGTSQFAVPVLEQLANLDFVDLVAVITQPDRAVGRHQSDLQAPPVKEFAQKLKNIEISQPESIKAEAREILAKYKPELIIVASYGQIIPKSMIDYPQYGCLNVHGSLLPDLRGAVPVQMAILKGYKKTGVTIQKMAKKMDSGDVLAKSELEIASKDTTESLMAKLSNLGAKLLVETLPGWIAGKIDPVEQDESKATYCYQKDIAKSQAWILPSTGIEQAERMIRAFYPWPVCWGIIKVGGTSKRLKIYRAQVSSIRHLGPAPGSSKLVELKFRAKDSKQDVLNLLKEDNRLFIQLSDGLLELDEIQLEGKKRMSAKDYLYLAN